MVNELLSLSPDDPTCDRLVGAILSSLTLDSTDGPVDLAVLAAELLVLFIYPHATGLPTAPTPDWDLIPGARGCTAQSCAFRDQHQRLSDLGVRLAGLSVQTVDEQREFAARVGLHYPLISDPARQLGAALDLPTFSSSERTFYKRLALIAKHERIIKVFYPVLEPGRNAADAADWLENEYSLDGR